MMDAAGARWISVECPGRVRKRRSELVIRVEFDDACATVSPVLGQNRLCKSCWAIRRTAAQDPGRLDATGDLVHAFETLIGLGRPAGDQRQRAALLRHLRRTIRETRTRTTGQFPPRLTTIARDGTARDEPVLPLAGCRNCFLPAQPESAGSLDATIGPHAGIITDLRTVDALPSEPEFPHTVVTRLANSRLEPGYNYHNGCSGKGATREVAFATACAESLERYAAGSICRPIITARIADMSAEFVAPELLAPFASGTTCRHQPLEWVAAQAVNRPESSVYVPASAVYLRSSRHFTNSIIIPGSNGLACAPTLARAIDSGFAEVLERHVFFETWYGIRAPLPYDEAGRHDDAVGAVREAFRRHDLFTRVIYLGCESGVHVAACVCWPFEPGNSRPQYALGLGTGDLPEAAVRKSVLELGQVYRGLSWALRSPSLAARADALTSGAAAVDDPYDHGLLYARRGPADIPAPFGLGSRRRSDEPGTVAADWRGLALAVELTTEDVAVSTGWKVARVIVPGTIPYHSGREAVVAGRKLTGTESYPLHPLN